MIWISTLSSWILEPISNFSLFFVRCLPLDSVPETTNASYFVEGTARLPNPSK